MKTIIIISILFFSFVPSQRCTILKNINNKKVSLFINSIYDDALIVQENTGVPLAIIIAQSALESGFGTSRMCKDDCNYFGVRRNHEFMVYENMDDSFTDYSRIFSQSCYSELSLKTLDDYYSALIKCKYSGGSYERRIRYTRKLKWIINRFGLNKLN